MTDERYYQLMRDDDEKLTKDELDAGRHFCYDWDGLLVGPGMEELDHCCCKEANDE